MENLRNRASQFEDIVHQAVEILMATGNFAPRRRITPKTFANAVAQNLLENVIHELMPNRTVGERLVAKEVIRQEPLVQGVPKRGLGPALWGGLRR